MFQVGRCSLTGRAASLGLAQGEHPARRGGRHGGGPGEPYPDHPDPAAPLDELAARGCAIPLQAHAYPLCSPAIGGAHGALQFRTVGRAIDADPFGLPSTRSRWPKRFEAGTAEANTVGRALGKWHLGRTSGLRPSAAMPGSSTTWAASALQKPGGGSDYFATGGSSWMASRRSRRSMRRRTRPTTPSAWCVARGFSASATTRRTNRCMRRRPGLRDYDVCTAAPTTHTAIRKAMVKRWTPSSGRLTLLKLPRRVLDRTTVLFLGDNGTFETRSSRRSIR